MIIENLTCAQLDQLIATNDKPVVIDVYATWCGPCKMFAPIFERVAEACGQLAYFAKADVDAVPEIAERYGVQHVPTLIAVKDGVVAHQSSGVMNESAFKALLEKLA